MFTLERKYVGEELWYSVYEDGILVGAWVGADLPVRYYYLLKEKK